MKRKYHTNLEFIESGFRACWRNATDLLASARMLLDAKHLGVSLSLSVLTMEEIGKMMFLDGLLFSRTGDYKHENFKSGYRKHQWKLQFLDLFPFFVNCLATADPRYGKEKRYNLALAISLSNYKRERSALSPWLREGCDLTQLDNWKQRGFYASIQADGFVVPGETISEDFARAVHTLAWRFTTTVDFALKNGNVDRYFNRARKFRSEMTESDHQFLEAIGSEIANEIFGESDGSDEGESGGAGNPIR